MDYFELVWAESQSLDSRESKKDNLYTGTLHMYLDERDNRTAEMQALRVVSHGTLHESRFFSRIFTGKNFSERAFGETPPPPKEIMFFKPSIRPSLFISELMREDVYLK